MSIRKGTQALFNLQNTQKIKKIQKMPRIEVISQQMQQSQMQQDLQDYRNLKLGFLGVGTISKSMVRGLCNPNLKDQQANFINLSPRGTQNVRELEAEFEQVEVMKSNQEVIDSSDWVIVGLLTTQVEPVLKTLKFREDQTIINLAAMPNDKFSQCVNGSKKLVRACPLPPIALNVGATIINPPHSGVEKMFNALGSSVSVKSNHETYSLQGIACLMGAQYQLFETCYDWMVNTQKIDKEIAKKYIMGTYHSICVDALDKIENKGHSFKDLVEEQTPGGLNETNLKYLQSKGVNDEFRNVLEQTYNKMVNKN